MKCKNLVFAFLMAVLSVGAQAQALRGGGGGHVGGGGEPAADFAGIAQRFGVGLLTLCQPSVQPHPCPKVAEVIQVLKIMRVVAQDTVLGPDGKPRDAINNRKDEIILSSRRWMEIKKSRDADEARVRLVAHEVFSIAQLEASDNYSVSGPVVDAMKARMIDIARISGSEDSDCAIAQAYTKSLMGVFTLSKVNAGNTCKKSSGLTPAEQGFVLSTTQMISTASWGGGNDSNEIHRYIRDDAFSAAVKEASDSWRQDAESNWYMLSLMNGRGFDLSQVCSGFRAEELALDAFLNRMIAIQATYCRYSNPKVRF